MAFVGRQKELEHLEKLYRSDRAETCVILGRRRIGKTALIKKFIEDKRAVYVQFNSGLLEDHIRMICRSLKKITGEEESFDSFFSALDRIGEICREERTVVVFDEYPYIVQTNPDLSSNVQNFVDNILDDTNGLFILCGSTISVMEREVSDYSRPLFNRFPDRMHLGEMPLSETILFHPDFSDIDNLKMYLTFGGHPYYQMMLEGKDYDDCLWEGVLAPFGKLTTEVENMLGRELPDPEKYGYILTVIAAGAKTESDISRYTGFPHQTCHNYITKLLDLGIITCTSEMLRNEKKNIFHIQDGLISFDRMVLRNNNYQDADNKNMVLQSIRSDVDSFIGKRFELYCIQTFKKMYPCKHIGQWQGKIDGEYTDIDLVAHVTIGGRNAMVFGECKFRKRKTGFDALNQLTYAVSHLDDGKKYMILCLFSSSGFTEDLEEYAEDHGILLFDADVLLGRKQAPELHRRFMRTFGKLPRSGRNPIVLRSQEKRMLRPSTLKRKPWHDRMDDGKTASVTIPPHRRETLNPCRNMIRRWTAEASPTH